jgi:glycosyltransferase involved in cell wall biosynthesis
MPSNMPKILAVSPGDPLNPGSWAGITQRLLHALSRQAPLAGAVSSSWAPISYLEKAATFSRDGETWRQRHDALNSPFYSFARRVSSFQTIRRARLVEPRPDALLQIGAYTQLNPSPGLHPRLRCSLHDANIAVFMRRADRAFPASRWTRQAFAFEQAVYDGIDLIMCLSDWVRRSFVDDFAQDPAKVVVVGAGANVDVPSQPPARDFTRPRLLFVGKRFRAKGGPQLLQAFEQVHARRPEAELWIVGPEKPPPPQPGVRFFGRVRRTPSGESTELDGLYAEATAFVMPSIYEAFGIVYLEAMAFGLPCVGSNVCAVPEIIDDGTTGLLAPPGDVDALAARLLELVENPERAYAMGEAGYRRRLERFTWERVAERMISEISARLG